MNMRGMRIVGVVLGCGVLMGVGAVGPETAADMRKARAQRQLEENERHLARSALALDRASLPEMDPGLIERYMEMIEYLSAPEREGRVPGSNGIEQAAVYIETRFGELGLVPAFDEVVVSPEGIEVVTGEKTFRQGMQMGVSTSAAVATMRVGDRELVNGEDFSVLAYSGSGEVDAEVTFTGYAVVSGPGGYMGFENDSSLKGRIALCLNYEPMDEEGRSFWRDEKWSHHSRLTYKVSALSRRNAAAILIVSPPNADDERVDLLETIESTSPANVRMGIGKAPKFDIPVLMVTVEVAEMIVAMGGDAERTLGSLIARANQHGVVEELDGGGVQLKIEMQRTPTMTSNIGAVLEGQGSLRDEYIVVGGHYDHLGYGKFGSRIASNAGRLHPGADDNASGTAGMLLAAEMMRNQYALLGPDEDARSVLFLAFTAEESGLNGSEYYTDHPIAAIEDHSLMLNMDMIGRLESDPLEIGGMEMTPGLEEFAEPFFEQSGLVTTNDSSVGSGRSDHASFNAKKIPAMFLFTGLHDQYHTPEDTVDLIDADGGVRIAVLCSQIGFAAATTDERLMHKSKGKKKVNKEPTVRIGIIPSNAGKGGMMIDRVFDETSASSAGLQSGDRIVRWDGELLESVESWRPTLGEMSPGDEVVLEVERNGEIIEVVMTLRAIE